MITVPQKHLASLAPYADFTFANAAPPAILTSVPAPTDPPSSPLTPTFGPLQCTPAVSYHALLPNPNPNPAPLDATVTPSPDRRLHFTAFRLQDPTHTRRPATPSHSLSREDLVRVLTILLDRYVEAADLAADVKDMMNEPLGKPDATWCFDIHRSVMEVVKRRLEMVRESRLSSECGGSVVVRPWPMDHHAHELR